MAFGPGKYDDVCTQVRDSTMAQGVVVIVIGGRKGSGFSCQADPIIAANLPDMLELVAKQMREDMTHD